MNQAAYGQRKSFRNRNLALAIITLLFFSAANAQYLPKSNSYGNGENRRYVDSTLFYPTGCGSPSLQSVDLHRSAIFFDSCNHRFYFYDPKRLSWDTIETSSSASVSNVSAGNLSPLFTGSVTNPTTTPLINFTLNSQAQYTIFNRGSGTGLPSWSYIDSNYFNSQFASQIRNSVDSRYAKYIDTSGMLLNYLRGGVINWPTIYSTPTVGSISGNIITYSPSFASQANYTLLGRGSGSGVPSFLSFIDSNWVPMLHSALYYQGINDAKYGLLSVQNTNTSNIATNTSNIAANTSSIALKANIASPTFTGVVTAPNLALTGMSLVTGVGDSSVYYNPSTNRLEYGARATGGGGGSSISYPFTTNKYLNGYGNFPTLNTDSISEGTTNKFFTNTRAQSAISVSPASFLTYSSGVIGQDTTKDHSFQYYNLRYQPIGSTSFGNSFVIDTSTYYGNSITQGAQAYPRGNRWATRLARLLGTVEDNRGISGTTMGKVSTGDSSMIDRILTIPKATAGRRYIIFDYGVNDATHGIDSATFSTAFKRVIDTCLARGWTTSQIKIVSPTLQGLANDVGVNAYRGAAAAVASLKGVQYVDVYTAMVNQGKYTLVSADSIHPNNNGYRVIGDTAFAQFASTKSGGVLNVLGTALISSSLTIGDSATVGLVNQIPYYKFYLVGGDAQINGMTLGLGKMQNSFNTVLGYNALNSSTVTATGQTAIGYQSLQNNITGTNNTAVGSFALLSALGYQNTAIGHNAVANLTGSVNTGIGFGAAQGSSSSSATSTTAVGAFALQTVNASGNTAVGESAGPVVVNGAGNSLFGHDAGYQLGSGSYNAAFGQYALYSSTGGGQNVAFGRSALQNATASNLTAIGYSAGVNNTSGTNNTYVGWSTGAGLTTGSNNTIIGANVSVSSSLASNVILADGNGTIRFQSTSTGATTVGTSVKTGGLILGYTAQSANYTALVTDHVIEITATGVTITLPTAVGATGQIYRIKLTASGTGSLSTTSSQTIDGATTYSLSAQYKYVEVTSNGANWIITANN